MNELKAPEATEAPQPGEPVSPPADPITQVLPPPPGPAPVTLEAPPLPETVKPIDLVCPDCGQVCGQYRWDLWNHAKKAHGKARGDELIKEVNSDPKFKVFPWRPKANAPAPKAPKGQAALIEPEPPPPSFEDVRPDRGAPITPEALPGAPMAPPGPNYEELSAVIFGMATGTLANIFGPEWKPTSPEEQLLVCKPLEAYLRSKNMPDLPPGVMLCFVCAVYAAPRFRAPSTRQKIGGAWYWFKSKVGGVFRRRGNAIPVIVKKEEPQP